MGKEDISGCFEPLFVLLGWVASLGCDTGSWASLTQPGAGKELLPHRALAQPGGHQQKQKTSLGLWKIPRNVPTGNVFILAGSRCGLG